jgi:hypothetical protein
MARRKPADTVHLRLRFPEKLRRRIEAAAEKNQQSMNLEIVERLERSFQHDDEAERSHKLAQETADAYTQALINLGFISPIRGSEEEERAEYERAREEAEEIERMIDQEVERLRALKKQRPKKRREGEGES